MKIKRLKTATRQQELEKAVALLLLSCDSFFKKRMKMSEFKEVVREVKTSLFE
jgi:hypothetical protein